ncbi:Uncharacterised protein [Mycobacteroides abscessus subsp. abscessus]|nr:Uncharacterised protein [Mycobacteroides abscessus subsp. abscessus]
MAIPATGTTWKAGGFNDVDNRFLERGGLIAALVRDARGSATNITPTDENGTVLWSPFAEDGQLRDDLFAFKKVDGFWVTNPEANEGFHLVGAFKEGDGPKKKGSLDTDDYMIEQSNFPFDSIITKEEETFSFTAVDCARIPACKTPCGSSLWKRTSLTARCFCCEPARWAASSSTPAPDTPAPDSPTWATHRWARRTPTPQS